MFTEGLDEAAINWIKKGPATTQEPCIRSPLTEKLSLEPFSKSPISYNVPISLMSPHGLPPLKFHSGLLAPLSLVDPCIQHEDEEESFTSSSNYVGDNFSDEAEEYEEEEVLVAKPIPERYDDGEEMFGYRSKSKLNRGLMNERDLTVEVPGVNRRLTDSELGTKFPISYMNTPTGGRSCQTERPVQLPNAQGTYKYGIHMLGEVEQIGTPSAPPIMESGIERRSFPAEIRQNENKSSDSIESESLDCSTEGGFTADPKHGPLKDPQSNESYKNSATEEQVQIPYWQTSLDTPPCYNTSGQYAWQALVAYDACIRLCLYAWGRGCTEAPEFLRDECLLLRSAFGLHKFLLQPRGVQPIEVKTTKRVEQMCPPKAKVVGKIRVEVKKLRVIQRRRLKSTNSTLSAVYMQVGAEYVRQVSSLVKTGMTSLKLPSFSVASEGNLSCLFQLKSAAEGAQVEPGSSVCLRPGTSDFHVFFPETEGDALLVEVQDKKNLVKGRATIPVSSLTNNQNERLQWWPIYHEGQECVGKMQLFIGSTITSDEANHIKSAPVVETLAYDLLLEAAMRAQNFGSRNLRLHEPWKWLLAEFADYYGVSDSYTKLRYLSHIMNVATPTKICLDLVNELLLPILKARSERTLTRQEKSILFDCETQIDSLLVKVFENYKSLDEDSPTGLADIFGPVQESTAPALVPAVQVYTLLHDILSQDAQTMLKNYLQRAAKKRSQKHMLETEEFVTSNSEGLLLDSVTTSTAYLKMKNLCINISKEIEADIKINNEHVLPSSIDLSNIAAAVYSTELCNRLRAFLASWPPSSPQVHVNEVLITISDFERDLESWGISPVQGGVDSRALFHDYIMVWVHDMELKFLDHCKAEKVPWSGVMTNHSTSPFAEEMYEKIKDSLVEYEVVISRWPKYSLVLENAVAIIERAIVKALEKQYNDILAPLKDSIPKKLNMHVQKLTRRQSTTHYSVPNQLGTFLNTMKRILDVLHSRIEDIFKSWASYLPDMGDKKTLYGEQMNATTVMLKTKYKNYMQATVEKLVNNTQTSKNTRLKKILEEINEVDGEIEVRERMQMLNSHLIDSISNLHNVFTSHIFVATCRGFWDRMGQVVLRFLEGRKENRVWYNGSFYALGVLDDTFASQMQRLQGNSLQEKDLEPPRSVIEARSILCKDTTNATDSSTYFYV